MVLFCVGKAFELTSSDGVYTVREELAEMGSTQEESDSRIICTASMQRTKATNMLLSRVLIQMSSSSLCNMQSGLKTLETSLRQEGVKK